MMNFSNGLIIKEWDRLKGVFKEMKRRRGDGKAIKIELNFSGEPDINFILQSDQSQWFKMEVEKIDFVVELLPYHLRYQIRFQKMSKSIVYNFDQDSSEMENNYCMYTNDKEICEF